MISLVGVCTKLVGKKANIKVCVKIVEVMIIYVVYVEVCIKLFEKTH